MDGGETNAPQAGAMRMCARSVGECKFIYHRDADINVVEDGYHARYMDGFMLLIPTHWRLRRRVSKFNHYFELDWVKRYSDKKFSW